MRALNSSEILGGALAVVALLAAPLTAGAQEAAVTSWLPWTGCWTEVDAPVEAPMTCIVPDDGGVEILTVTSGGVMERQTLRADGVQRPVSADGCSGVQAAEASKDGARLYTRSTLSCDGGPDRTTRGLMAMISPDEWVQVRALTVDNGSVSWVRRYRVAPGYRLAAAGLPEVAAPPAERSRAVEAARISASRAPSVDAIIEASGRTDPEAVRAWIAEQGAPIRLDADRLIRMADAGVSEAVIDVVVAVSHPDRFAVARQPERRPDDAWDRRDRYGYGFGGRGAWPSYYDPFYYDGFYSPLHYGRVGYGYGSFGYGSPGYYGSPTVIIVLPVGTDTDAPPGRAVKGRGYTRGGTSAASGTVRPASPSSARSGGYTSGASSSSGSSSSKGKAKPKPKGGG